MITATLNVGYSSEGIVYVSMSVPSSATITVTPTKPIGWFWIEENNWSRNSYD